MGNISPLILLGIIGFLYFEKRNQLFLAGASTAIVSVKAHLLYLFWVGFILWIWKHRRWRVAFGAITAGLVAAVIPVIFDPWVYYEFIHMYRFPGRSTPFELPAPSLGSLLTLYLPHGKNSRFSFCHRYSARCGSYGIGPVTRTIGSGRNKCR
jgi:hypothetical protein